MKGSTNEGVLISYDGMHVYCTQTEENPCLRKGDTVMFGRWEQNRPEATPIAWTVLMSTANKALMLSNDALASLPYDANGFAYWEKSTLKQWLEVKFVETAFSKVEAQALAYLPTCLSWGEASEFLGKRPEFLRCMPTAYTIDMGGAVDDGRCCWWLRGEGEDKESAAYVNYAGLPILSGYNVRSSMGVRPAIWVSLGPVTTPHNEPSCTEQGGA